MPALRLSRTLLLAVVVAAPLCGQSLTTTTAAPTGSTPIGGALTFDLQLATTLSLTTLDFWTGPSTPAGASASVDVYVLPAGLGLDTTRLSLSYQLSWARVGSTAPVSLAAGGSQLVTGAALVPAAPFTSVTLPSGPFAVALVANGCDLATVGGHQTAANAELSFVGRWQQDAFLNSQPVAATFVGALGYTFGAAPMPLGTISSFGAGCGGLQLQVLGQPVRGGTLTLQTAAPTGGVGLCLISDRVIAGPQPSTLGIDLGALGFTSSCFAYVPVGHAYGFTIVDPGGTTVALTIPNFAIFYGYTLVAQSVWIPTGASVWQLSTSDAAQIRIG